jgi:hypothetical protein
VTARSLEALIRLSQAHAKLHMADSVEAVDVAVASRILDTCYTQVGVSYSRIGQCVGYCLSAIFDVYIHAVEAWTARACWRHHWLLYRLLYRRCPHVW